MAGSTQQYCYWLLDVRNVWPGSKIDDAAPYPLSLVPTAEASKARGFHFLKDAKLSLASSLLKRLFATTARGIPWADARFARRGNRKHGKPCLLANPAAAQGAQPSQEAVQADQNQEQHEEEADADFNISHQAGLVALAGVSGTGAIFTNGPETSASASAAAAVKSVGVDIVCVGERNDARSIERSGFMGWIDMHVDVFSDADLGAMKAPVGGVALGRAGTGALGFGAPAVQAAMRRFYAYWALKEAYVKLEGEALLADWLREVEFRGVEVPSAAATPAAVVDSGGDGGGTANAPADGENGRAVPAWGEVTTGIEVWVRGKRRQDVDMFLQAFDDNYMIATALLKHDVAGQVEIPRWKVLQLETDVYPFAT